jgi:hypothetical protein
VIDKIAELLLSQGAWGVLSLMAVLAALAQYRRSEKRDGRIEEINAERIDDLREHIGIISTNSTINAEVVAGRKEAMVAIRELTRAWEEAARMQGEMMRRVDRIEVLLSMLNRERP